MTDASLLLHLAHEDDPQRVPVAATLAALVARAPRWRYDHHVDARRDGRHFGAGDPSVAGPGAGRGSLLAGSGVTEQLLWLLATHRVVAVGDPASSAWPTLIAGGAEVLCRDDDPAAIYASVLELLDAPVPRRLVVVDAAPQGTQRVVVAPYLIPASFVDGSALALEVSAGATLVDAVCALLADDAGAPLALYVDPERLAAFPRSDVERVGRVGDAGYADVTAALCARHASWGRGVFLGDPALVASQVAKIARLQLLPIHGRPQVDVLELVAPTVRRATEPVYGRQWDDQDFFALARLGHGLHVVDGPPPFDTVVPRRLATTRDRAPATAEEPTDAHLARWADEGRILTTLLFWAGMIREAECYPPIVDLLTATGMCAGIVTSVDAIAHAPRGVLPLLDVPVDRGGVQGNAELLVGSTGFGVAAEAEMPAGTLARSLSDARQQLGDLLPSQLVPRGWWPLLDTGTRPHRTRRFTRRGLRPVVRLRPGRSIANAVVHRINAYRWTEERRPFDDVRPSGVRHEVIDAVRAAGFAHMWSKAGFGDQHPLHVDDDLIALPFTAGAWDGWSPFYTLSSVRQLRRAEEALTSTERPGWLVTTIDSPLWLLTGERLERASWLYEVARELRCGGRSGRLVNTTPSVIARYARLLDARHRTSDLGSSVTSSIRSSTGRRPSS